MCSHSDPGEDTDIRNVRTPSPKRESGSRSPLKRENEATFTTAAKRRKMDDAGHFSHPEDGENQDDNSSSVSSGDKRRLACPFFKRKLTTTRPSCIFPGFSNIARLKEHLYRQHMQPQHRCPRCMARFKSDAELRDHSRAEVPCPINPDIPLEGITMEQEKALKSKRRVGKSGASAREEEKWNEIYSILFPNETIPSPYCDTASVALDYEDSLKRELPSYIKNAIDKLLDSSEDYKQINIIKVVGQCLDTLFSRWRQEADEPRLCNTPSAIS